MHCTVSRSRLCRQTQGQVGVAVYHHNMSSADADADAVVAVAQASEWDVPCEECGRSYPHKHVRAVYESNLNTGYGDEDASD